MKVSERTAQYEKLLSMSKSVIRECIILHDCDDPDGFWEWSNKEVLTVEPHFTDSRVRFYYETGEQTKRYSPGSVGAMSGLNSVTAELPDEEDDIANLFCNEKSWKEMEETE